MKYHIGEEFLIAFICLFLGIKALRNYLKYSTGKQEISPEITNRIYLVSMGFFLLAVNSALHSVIHVFELSSNLLFHTLFGYSLGFLLLIFSISFRDPSGKKFLPLILYLPFFIILLPWIYPLLPPFTEFRPLVWVLITYLSGILFMLFVALFQNTRLKSYLRMSLGFLLVAISGIFLFFPSSIGSVPWTLGHLMRPLGFIVLLFSLKEENLINLKGSILYRALISFSLLAAIPLLFFGVAIFYEEINPLGTIERRFLIFALILFTLIAALIFGIGTVIRLIKPILELQKGVDSLSTEGFEKEIKINTGDEIEELTGAFNKMVHDLKGSIKEQERLSRLAAMGELAARLAHEIRNPLNAIEGAASYISKNYKGELLYEFLHIIREEVSRINILTTSLLSFAKPVLPQSSLSDINEVVNETVNLINQEFMDKEIMLDVYLNRDIHNTMFDRNQIKQVIINLLLNALEVSEKGHKVEVTSERSDGLIVVSVKDSGKGISEKEMENIFKPFYTTKTKGTGLGLAIAEKFLKEHGGEIRVESTNGRGSKFSLYLPIKK